MRLFFKKNQGASELRSSPARINHTKNLSERVIDELLQKNDILPEDVAIDALALQRRYALAEQISIQKEAEIFHVPLEDIDYVVCLSGRSGFYGQYEEAKDTVRRFLYAVMVAKQATLNNLQSFMAYFLLLIMFHKNNQQDTPPNLFFPYTRFDHNS